MDICKKSECTGCYACISACVHDCITMQENEYGESHPVVEEKKCVHCNACINVCPNNSHRIEYRWPERCYASWITNKEKRCKCASGGIATALSEFVIQYKNGVVFGTAYDDDFTPRITYTENIEGVEKYKGSKYVQGIVGEETYRNVRAFLKEGRFVLFTGTPCQIAGLQSYLKQSYDNLITVDLICHGVSPTKYFKEEIGYLLKKFRITNLSDIRFRGNDNNNYSLSLWENRKRVYRAPKYTDYYLGGFLLGVTLRDNCYSCKYARPDRISDITIGDFLKLGKKEHFPYPVRNVSSVTLNTDKGLLFYEELIEIMPEIMNIKRDYSERLEYKPSLLEPSARPPLTSSFRAAYLEGGYIYASRKVLTPIVKSAKRNAYTNKIKFIIRLPYKLIKNMVKKRNV